MFSIRNIAFARGGAHLPIARGFFGGRGFLRFFWGQGIFCGQGIFLGGGFFGFFLDQGIFCGSGIFFVNKLQGNGVNNPEHII